MSFVTIVIDSREQQPYGFGCATDRRKLEAGDYSVAGCESQIAVERKSVTPCRYSKRSRRKRPISAICSPRGAVGAMGNALSRASSGRLRSTGPPRVR